MGFASFVQAATAHSDAFHTDAHLQARLDTVQTFTARKTFDISSPVIKRTAVDTEAPELLYQGFNGWWGSGIDVAAAVKSRDFVVAFKGMGAFNSGTGVRDLIYCSHNGAGNPTVGIGKSQPGSSYRLWVIGADQAYEEATMGALKVQGGYNAAGVPVMALTNYGGTDRMWVDPAVSSTWAWRLRGDSTTSNPVLVAQDSGDDAEKIAIRANGSIRFLADNNAVLSQPFASAIKASQNFIVGNFLGVGSGVVATPGANVDVSTTGANNASLRLRTASNGNVVLFSSATAAACSLLTQNASSLALGTNGAARINIGAAGELGFFGAAAIAKPTGVAVTAAGIHAALVSLGLIAA